MSTITKVPYLKLTKTAFPQNDPSVNASAYITALRKDPTFCAACCNLFPGSASVILGLGRVFCHETFGIRNPKEAVNRSEDDGTSPDWAGKSRVDYASWQITTSLVDVAMSAEKGCPSCYVLMAGIEGLEFDGIVSSDASLDLIIVSARAMS